MNVNRLGFALTVWFANVLLLWLAGGLGLRPSLVLSLVIAGIFDQLIVVDRVLLEPKGGVRCLSFDVDLGSILWDLGVIDSSTDMKQIDTLVKRPYAAFPHLRETCVWIPQANLLVWPGIQDYQSQSKLALNVAILLPAECPLAESIHRDVSSRYGEEHRDSLRLEEVEEATRMVKFFIEDGYPDYAFGLRVPKAFAEERIKAGGFANVCTEYKEEERYEQFRLVVGRFPADLFRPHFPENAPFRKLLRQMRAQGKFDKRLKDRFEELGWTLEDHQRSEHLPPEIEVAKHKYMEIEIDNRER